MAPIFRTTMFKVHKQEDLPTLVELYAKMRLIARKDNEPYILSCYAGPTIDDSPSHGYDFVAQSKFASREDMDYYDTQCEAHKQLKAELKGKIALPPMTTCYEDALSGS